MAGEDGAAPAHHADLDATGLRCPMPVLKARRRLAALATGEVLRVSADDPLAPIDIANFCREAGHELVLRVAKDEATVFYIRKQLTDRSADAPGHRASRPDLRRPGRDLTRAGSPSAPRLVIDLTPTIRC